MRVRGLGMSPQGDEPMLGPRFGLFGLLGRPSLGRKARVGLESDSSFRSSERGREQTENQLLQKSSGHCRHLLLVGLTTALTTLWVGWGGVGRGSELAGRSRGEARPGLAGGGVCGPLPLLGAVGKSSG